ncbi:hypothetical protein PBI_WAITS_46 [Gordonia phage Waits]|uniref:Uncharacterized protein n=1 Tax=Gordonia phage Waits TaxID=2108120 RepID=A0A2P1JSE6_9CAUD|nr:hypothetical protein FDJ48_gp064 [Gordonia phage Waits]AVO22076.1 hypothetical protein PBI_WAITS_46 [Gordonia phage Waits]
MTIPNFKATKTTYEDVDLSVEHAEGLSHIITVDPADERHYRQLADAINWFFDTKPAVLDPQAEAAKRYLEKAGYTVSKSKWDRLEDIPKDTPFTQDSFFHNDDFSTYYLSNGDGTADWESLGGRSHEASVSNIYGPFHAIPAEHLKGH